jgi:hypothetical protein
MSRHASSDNSNAIGLFPFLAVLLCTMGALLVLLVILAQRAGERAAAEMMQGSPDAKLAAATGDSAELVRQLDEVRRYQQKLDELSHQGESRLHDEQARLSHREEHTRRLEHELAQLTLAAQQLAATEKHQSVDQKQAEAELERLRQLLADTEQQLEELRRNGSGKRSYAVVPFQGQNGTQRKPVYIECTGEGITLQPEGLRFERGDFLDPTWPGNPLAAALRASREYLNAQAAQAGQPEPPDPYPLILVRPDGIMNYLLARAAITSWDSDFGYEFIEQDWKIDYPDLPDPQLAQAQQHAVWLARERLLRLVQAAPSQFRSVAMGAGRGGRLGNDSRGGGYGAGGEGDGSDGDGALAQSYGGGSAAGNGAATGEQTGSSDGPGDGEPDHGGDFQYGSLSGELASASGPSGQTASASGPSAQTASASGPSGQTVSASGPSGQSTSAGTAGSAPQPFGQPGDGSATAMANAGAGDGAAGSSGGAAASASVSAGGTGQPSSAAGGSAGASPSLVMAPKASIAESRGSDWAVQKTMRNAIPVRRTIHVVVRRNQMALLPSRHASEGLEASGTVISLDQPLDRISDEFITALKTRVDEWGLAGNGLYWRPVLELHVGPDADQTAMRLNHLLKDSGVEVRLPETAQLLREGREHATR